MDPFLTLLAGVSDFGWFLVSCQLWQDHVSGYGECHQNGFDNE